MDSDSTEDAIARQMRSAVTMLRFTIEHCPDTLWLAGEPNQSWHLAYHALFYTHFYLGPGEREFVAWKKHRPQVNYLGERCSDSGKPYTQTELMEYADFCLAHIDAWVRQAPLDAPSGFSWLPMTRLEVHLYNLRHLAHHEGQLADRLRAEAGIGVPWVR